MFLKWVFKMLNFTEDEYSSKSSAFEKAMDGVYKKNHGVFYTDFKLSKLILEYLEVDTDKSILDPCCGTGSFLCASLEKGFNKVYGADLDLNAVKLCRKFTGLSLNVKKMDTLGENGSRVLKALNLKDKVDYVIGNPPYGSLDKNIVIETNDYLFQRKVKDSGNNLFVAAMYRAFEMVKSNGIISYIIPKNFLHIYSYASLRKFILHDKKILSVIDLGACFSSVRGEQILVTLKNSFPENNRIKILKFVDGLFKEKCVVEQSFYSDEILLFQSDAEYNIYKKLEDTYLKFSDICTGYVGRGKSKSLDAVSGKDIRKFGFKNHTIPQKGNQVFIQNIYSAEAGIIASFAGNELEASQTVTVFTDGDEKMCRYMVGILHSRLCNFYLIKFCYNSSKLTMHTDAKYLKKLPLKRDDDILFDQLVNLVKAIESIEYMSEDWFEMLESLNVLVYKIYGISSDEIRYIDKEMFALQSERWKK